MATFASRIPPSIISLIRPALLDPAAADAGAGGGQFNAGGLYLTILNKISPQPDAFPPQARSLVPVSIEFKAEMKPSGAVMVNLRYFY